MYETTNAINSETNYHINVNVLKKRAKMFQSCPNNECNEFGLITKFQLTNQFTQSVCLCMSVCLQSVSVFNPRALRADTAAVGTFTWQLV